MIDVFKKQIPLFFIIVITLFFSTYKLTESPKTWMDEGIIIQVSKNISDYGKHALQIGPNEFVSAGIVSTGYPVTYPISLSFDIFGAGILQARIVMVLFILLLIIFSFYYLKNNYGPEVAFLGSILLATFSPIYGHGKNVLGEIPGMVFFMGSLLFFDKIQKNPSNILSYLFLGLFLGLTFSTKSIFVLLLPALFATFLWQVYKGLFVWTKNYIYTFLFFLLVFTVWIFVQFEGDSLSNILTIYSNPHSVPLLESIQKNVKLFFTDLQPIYYLCVIIIWSLSFILRLYRKEKINPSEFFSIFFSILVFLAFFRTIGYYRYFFISQFLSLVFLVPSLRYLFNDNIVKKIIFFGIALLACFHAYQTLFNSWVATYYSSTKTQVIYENIDKIDYSGKVIFYQTPELVVFSQYKDYYQYINIAELIKIGEDNAMKVKDGFFDTIIINSTTYSSQPEKFSIYEEVYSFDQYMVLNRIENK